jgi:hypothetical protein
MRVRFILGAHSAYPQDVAVEELVRRGKQRLRVVERFAVALGGRAAGLPPEHLDRIQTRAAGQQVQQHEAPRRGAEDRLDVVVLVRAALSRATYTRSCESLSTRAAIAPRSHTVASGSVPPLPARGANRDRTRHSV